MRTAVSVDRALCRGAGLCEVMDDRLFRLDDEGLAVAVEPAGDHHDDAAERLREIADCCPTGAISVMRAERGSPR